jgi:hypothetical protein
MTKKKNELSEHITSPKGEFLVSMSRELDELVTPFLEKKMEQYRRKFGYKYEDAMMWLGNADVSFCVASVGSTMYLRERKRKAN